MSHLPVEAYRALEALQLEAEAAAELRDGKTESSKKKQKQAQNAMKNNQPWTLYISKILTHGRSKTTLETANASWLEKVFEIYKE